MAEKLAEAGLKRVNLSFDSLDPQRFAALTRGGSLKAVLEAIAAARKVGLWPIKLNMVVMGGENDQEILPMIRYFLPYADSTILRFIEYMPFEDRRYRNVPAAEIRRQIEQEFPLQPDESPPPGGGPARYWRAGDLKIGFISPITEHFCALCNRLRLLADGDLRTCLAHENNPNLRDLLRSGISDTELMQTLRQIVWGKPAGHEALMEGGRNFEGTMTSIGG